MICPNCEKEIEPTAQCPHCGCHFPVSYMPKPAPIPVPAIEKQQKMNTAEKAALPEIPKVAAEQECPECGKPVPPKAQFCKWCGSPLSKEKENPQIVSDDQPAQTENVENDLQPEERHETKAAQPEMAKYLDEKTIKPEMPEFPDEKAALPEIPKVAEEQECPECGKPVQLTARFCKWCGSPLSKEKDAPQPALDQATNNEENTPSTKICESCGGTIKATASFCKWCGSPCNDKKENEE